MDIDFTERLERALKYMGKCNCIGTGLFLSGAREEDGFVDIYDHPGFFTRVVPIRAPQPRCLVAWQLIVRDRIYETSHVGILSEAMPWLITHRDGKDGPIEIDRAFADVYRAWTYNAQKQIVRTMKFYWPQRIIT